MRTLQQAPPPKSCLTRSCGPRPVKSGPAKTLVPETSLRSCPTRTLRPTHRLRGGKRRRARSARGATTTGHPSVMLDTRSGIVESAGRCAPIAATTRRNRVASRLHVAALPGSRRVSAASVATIGRNGGSQRPHVSPISAPEAQNGLEDGSRAANRGTCNPRAAPGAPIE